MIGIAASSSEMGAGDVSTCWTGVGEKCRGVCGEVVGSWPIYCLGLEMLDINDKSHTLLIPDLCPHLCFLIALLLTLVLIVKCGLWRRSRNFEDLLVEPYEGCNNAWRLRVF